MDTPAIRQAKAEIGKLMQNSATLWKRQAFRQSIAAAEQALKRLGRSPLALLPDGMIMKAKLLITLSVSRVEMREPEIALVCLAEASSILSRPRFANQPDLDGSHFHPGLKRDGRYRIGAKGAETPHESFDDALAELHRMAVPRWRRPNEVGNWGIVSGREWKRIERRHLKSI